MSLLFTLLLAVMSIQGAPHQRPEMVIVVEDDAMDCYLAELYMRDYHVVVTTVRSADEGLQRVSVDHFDYGFVDLMLDNMTGLEFIRKSVSKNRFIKWYVFSDEWHGSIGSRHLAETARLGATAILKSSLRQNGLRMKNFQDTLGWILNPKPL